MKTTNIQKSSVLIKNISALLSAEQPNHKEAGQVWQIIPSDQSKEAQLGVIINHNILFDTVVMLKTIYDKASTEGNNACLFNGDSPLGMPFLAVYWKPFTKVLFKSNYGRFICKLTDKQLTQIQEAQSRTAEPQTVEGIIFRKECEYEINSLGYNCLKPLNFNINEVIDNLTNNPVQPAALLAAPSTQKQFEDFKYRLIEDITQNEEGEFFKKLYKDYHSSSEDEFTLEFINKVTLIFIGKSGEVLASIASEDNSITFNLESSKNVLDYYKVFYSDDK